MSKEKILVVDDEKDIAELLQYNLEKEGYKISAVFSGEECLKNVKTELPDLILLDLMLPEIDGLDVCKFLKNNPQKKKTSLNLKTWLLILPNIRLL